MFEKKNIYLDNAATSYPKPEAVLTAMTDYIRGSGNPGRGAHQYAMFAARQILEARLKVAEFLGIEHNERLIFSPGCTHSLNYVLKGIRLKAHDRVVLSGLEHNAVLRPLTQLKESNGIDLVELDLKEDGESFLVALEKTLVEKPVKLCVFTHASNVTGQILPLEKAVEIAKRHGSMTLVDAAQTAGKLSIPLKDSGIDFWCASGHKGLLGPPGVGLLYVAPSVELEPLISGGTGSLSESFSLPEFLPDRFEAGTLPGPNIAGLAAGVDCLSSKNLNEELNRQLQLVDKFEYWAREKEGITVYGPQNTRKEEVLLKMPVTAIFMEGISPGELSSMLNDHYQIAVRPGLHCAALVHKGLGTLSTGLTRISFGSSNTEADVEYLIESLDSVTSSLQKSLKKSV